MKNEKINQGFTLIELLVVISIIGFLATAAVFSFNIIRMQSRDAIRANNIGIISRSLALYMNDFGTYPTSSGECISTSGIGATLLSADVIPQIPTDLLWPTTAPTVLHANGYAIAPSANFCYYYSATDNNYYLSSYLESNSKAGDSGVHVMTPAGSLN